MDTNFSSENEATDCISSGEELIYLSHFVVV